MNKYQLNEISQKRSFEVTAEQLALLIVSKLPINQEQSEWVGKDQREKILTCSSRSAANKILTWGKRNGFPVRKRGASFWNKRDLENLSIEYWKVN